MYIRNTGPTLIIRSPVLKLLLVLRSDRMNRPLPLPPMMDSPTPSCVEGRRTLLESSSLLSLGSGRKSVCGHSYKEERK